MLSRSWARSRKSLPYRFPLARRTCNISRYSLKKSRVGELRRAEDLGNRAALVCFRVLLTCYGLVTSWSHERGASIRWDNRQ